MSSKYFNPFVTLLIVAVAIAAASPMPYVAHDSYAPLADEYQQWEVADYEALVHLRIARSPEGGSVGVGLSNDGSGTFGSVSYIQNLWQGRSANSRLDFRAQASKNFDHHGRPDVGAGLTFSHDI